jgi:hypothetical protein
MPLVNDIQALNPVYNKWYMDDGGIIGDVDLLKKVWTCCNHVALSLIALESLQMRVVLA